MPTRRSDHDEQTLARWASARVRLGARVRELRLAAGLTQESVSLESGISRNQLIAVEWGRSSLAAERLFDLAAALGVAPAALLEAPVGEPTREPHRGGRRPRDAGGV